jgi:hypothetical protein
VAPPATGALSRASQPIASLVQQIFFPAATVLRTQVLFAAADAETQVLQVCEQLGRALAEISGATVAIVGAAASPDATPAIRKAPSSTAGPGWWRSYSSQIADNLWRVPAAVITGRSRPAAGWIPEQGGGAPFDYLLFAASVADSEIALFCSICDGAVLVLTANHTRRESALRAKEQLLQCNAELLGAVLDGRTFPIPKAVYQRL